MNRIIGSFYFVVGFVIGFIREARYDLKMNAPCNCARCRHNIPGCHWEGFGRTDDDTWEYMKPSVATFVAAEEGIDTIAEGVQPLFDAEANGSEFHDGIPCWYDPEC